MSLTTKDLEALKAAKIGDVVTLEDGRRVQWASNESENDSTCSQCVFDHETCLPEHCVHRSFCFIRAVELDPNLRTYNPATHVVVSRECAEAALFNIPDSAEGGVSPREHAARAELRAALEVGK